MKFNQSNFKKLKSLTWSKPLKTGCLISALALSACGAGKNESQTSSAPAESVASEAAATAQTQVQAASSSGLRDGYVKIKGKWVKGKYTDYGSYATFGDIVLAKSSYSEAKPNGVEVGLLAYDDGEGKIATDVLWPRGVVSYNMPTRLSAKVKDAVKAAIAEIESKTPVRFKHVSGSAVNDTVLQVVTRRETAFPGKDVVVTGVGYHSDSADALFDNNGSKQPLNVLAVMNERIVERRIKLNDKPERLNPAVLRELVKVLGLDSELHRSDRDKYVRIENLKDDAEIPVLGGYESGAFDYESITLYGPFNDLLAKDSSLPIFKRKHIIKKTNEEIWSTALGGSSQLSQGDVRGISELYSSAPEQGFDAPFIKSAPKTLSATPQKQVNELMSSSSFDVEIVNAPDCSHLEVSTPNSPNSASQTYSSTVTAQAGNALKCTVEIACKQKNFRMGMDFAMIPAGDGPCERLNLPEVQLSLYKVKADKSQPMSKATVMIGESRPSPSMKFAKDDRIKIYTLKTLHGGRSSGTYTYSDTFAFESLNSNQRIGKLTREGSGLMGIELIGEDAQYFTLRNGEIFIKEQPTKDSYKISARSVSHLDEVNTQTIVLVRDLPKDGAFEIGGRFFAYYEGKERDYLGLKKKICEFKPQTNQTIDSLLTCAIDKKTSDGRKKFSADPFGVTAISDYEACPQIKEKRCEHAGLPKPILYIYLSGSKFVLPKDRASNPTFGTLETATADYKDTLGQSKIAFSLTASPDNAPFEITAGKTLKAKAALTRSEYKVEVLAKSAEGATRVETFVIKVIEEARDEALDGIVASDPAPSPQHLPFHECPSSIPLKVFGKYVSGDGKMKMEGNILRCTYNVTTGYFIEAAEAGLAVEDSAGWRTMMSRWKDGSSEWQITKYSTVDGRKPIFINIGNYNYTTKGIELVLSKNVDGHGCANPGKDYVMCSN